VSLYQKFWHLLESFDESSEVSLVLQLLDVVLAEEAVAGVVKRFSPALTPYQNKLERLSPTFFQVSLAFARKALER
jgi:hypothetical protein